MWDNTPLQTIVSIVIMRCLTFWVSDAVPCGAVPYGACADQPVPMRIVGLHCEQMLK